MGLFVRRAQPETNRMETLLATSLSERAIAFLNTAAGVQPDADALVIEERAVWQPDSWLLQQCWRALADVGAGQETLQVAALVEARNPLTRVQALYRAAQHIGDHPELRPLIGKELRQVSIPFFNRQSPEPDIKLAERLLYAGATAARLDNIPLACACLERMDQLQRTWDRLFLSMESRNVLAETVVHIGLHPLTNHLLAIAIRRYEEPGAQFLHQIMRLIGPRIARQDLPRRRARLMQRCVEVFQYSTLSTLTSRRLAATALGQAGAVREVLEQLTTIATVQSARQETGISSRSDPHFLRQVKRPTANLDIDFQVYTLQEAIKAMPVRTISREERILLADRVAELATRSDGWTAAGAAMTLVELGALKYAVNVVDFIPATDTTRSEGVISLVRALLTFGETQLAHEQVEKALIWAKRQEGRNPERALVWGLAEVYMEFGRPDRAIELLAHRYTPPGFGSRVRRIFNSAPNDDELRDNRLRLQALILQDEAWSKQMEMIYQQLREWAPRLLDGEALINFYMEGLLRPLFVAGKTDLVIELLPQVRAALAASTGDKHAVQIQKVAALLARAILPASPVAFAPHEPANEVALTEELGAQAYAEIRVALTAFLLELWAADASRGIWQMIHSLEGSLPLLLALEGPQAVVAIAIHAAETGQSWSD